MIFPCLNPSGLEVNTRENKEGIDLNRSFDLESNLPEVVFLIDNINIYDFKADLSIDFHETCPEDNCDITLGHKFPKEFYMYEVCTTPSLKIGHKILNNIKKEYKISDDENIFGDEALEGLISYPQNSKASDSFSGKTLDLFLFNNNYSKNALTIETMAHYPLKDRFRQIEIILNSI